MEYGEAVHIDKYNLDLDLANIECISFNTSYEAYEGGIDEEGHERKDNYSLHDGSVVLYRDDNNDFNCYDSETGSCFLYTIDDAVKEIIEQLDKGLLDDDISVIITETSGRTYELEVTPAFDKFSYEQKMEIAKHCIGNNLDALVKDDSACVRYVVAEHGRDKDMDILVNDIDSSVRLAVAHNGRPQDLDKLVNDNNEWVRREVARHGRPQDIRILENDDDEFVRSAVREYKEKHPDWDKPKSDVQKHSPTVDKE